MGVVALCFSPGKSADMVSASRLEVVAGSGIMGDRYFGSVQRYPGQNITLIEAEEIEAFNARCGTDLALTAPRRNVVTRDVRLNELVGVEFGIGSARFHGVELCEPCSTLAGHLAAECMSKARFIREFMHCCGLRADVVGSGSIRVADRVEVTP